MQYFILVYKLFVNNCCQRQSVGLQLGAVFFHVFSGIYGFKTSFPRVSVFGFPKGQLIVMKRIRRGRHCQVFIPQYSEEELAIMQRQAEIAEKVN